MNRPLKYVFAFVLYSLLLIAVGWSLAQVGPPEPANTSPFKGNLFTLLQQKPLSYDQEISNLPLHAGSTTSASLIQVRQEVKSHYHAAHDEIVYVLGGKGVMTVAGETRAIQAGDLVTVERGAVHSVLNKSAQPLVALSIMSPPFDGEDRIYTEPQEP